MNEGAHRLFCFGYGYSCDYLGYALQQAGGWEVAGTTRDFAKKALMHERGIRAYIFDYSKPLNDPQMFLRGTTHLLISTPPGDDGDPVFLMHQDDILRHHDTLRWVGYLSSTAVYGDRGGGWVDESAEATPTSKRGSRRALAEEQWLSLHKKHGLPVHVFRLAGIYGPGRSALDSVRAGVARRIDKPGHAFSRVHVDDIVGALIASMLNPAPGEIYNVCDDNAAPSHEVIKHACELLGLTPPPLIPFEDAGMAPIALSFYKDNKRVRNEKIKNALGVTLRYPDYRDGLRACLEAERHARQMLEHAHAEGSFGG